jgi:hypothetical protein
LEQYFRPHIVDSERVEHRLRGLGVELYCQNRPTDAFAQLLAGERGCFSSRNLVGKGKRLAREYVERRIALAKFAEQYGLGKLIARPRRRTNWQWDVSWLRHPTERRKMPFSYLTAEDEEAIAQLANWPPAPPTRRPEAYLR